MRILSLVFSFLVTLSLTAMALTYVPEYVGQQRIYVQGGSDSTPIPQPYHAYGDLGNADPDSAQTANGDMDQYHQRYYSESEGWTYYAHPLYSLARTTMAVGRQNPSRSARAAEE
jgi:hypothetical protein